MSQIRKQAPWIAGWVLSLAAVGGLGFMAQTHADRSPELQAPVIAGANDLSIAFRQVAQNATPCIVSIETKGKTVKMKGNAEDAFGEDSPFGDFFKNDPRFKEMFKNAPNQRQVPQRGMGSGFIIDSDGVILTNNHVVADADVVKVKLHDGREFTATDVKTDPRSDVAIVRIDAGGKLPAIPLGDSNATEVGDWVLAIGSPFGLDMTVTAGIISAKGRGPGIAEREDFLQTDAAINPGNSGGPLLNLNGEVVGINTAISSRSGGYEGIGFAIPINMARWVGRQLMDKGTVNRGFLGVGIQPVSNELAKQFNVPVNRGALVSQVMPDSPASAAKLEAGDIVLKLNDQAVNGPRGLQGIVEQLDIGKNYPLVVLRNGREVTLDIAIKEMPATTTVRHDADDEAAPVEPKSAEFDNLGVEVQELTPDVAKKLGYGSDVHGVVVSSVKEDSPAAAAGVRTGMVIEKVAQTKVQTMEEFRDALKGLKVDDGILLLVRNPRGTQFIVVGKPE